MAIALVLYVYSFYCFIRMILSIFRHDVGVYVKDDYWSGHRDAQRGSTIKWFVKSVLAFFLAGGIGYLFM